MADQKITALAATTTLADADLVPVVTDVGTTPTNKKITVANVKTQVNHISAANATDLTDSGDSTLHYHAADRNTDNHVDGTTNHVFTAADDTKLTGIEASANNYTHPATHSADIIVDGSTNHTFTAADDTKLTGIEAAADVTDATNVAAAGAVMEGDTTTASMSFVVDEDNMVSDLATKVPTQQSVKAYADGKIAKTTNITALNETGIADGELAVFNLTNKDIRTSNVTIVTTLGGDDTTVPTSAAVASAITAGGGYTDEMAQDAVGGMVADTSTIDLTYTDGTPQLTADVKDGSITLAKQANLAQNTIIGRVTASTGVPEALTAANVRTIINVADGANAYVHPNHSGDVTSVADGAQTIANDAVTYAKMQNVSATAKVLGRVSAGSGDVEEITIDTDLASVSANDDTVPSAKATKAMGDLKLPLAGGTMSGDITLGENTAVALDPAGSADEKWSGITCAGTAGATLAVGDLIYLDATAGEWLLADADAASTSGDVPLGLCILAANDGQATNILLIGTMRSAAFPASIALGAPVYVSTTAGDIQAAQPSGTDDVIRKVGWAISAEPNTIYFNPSNDYITHS